MVSTTLVGLEVDEPHATASKPRLTRKRILKANDTKRFLNMRCPLVAGTGSCDRGHHQHYGHSGARAKPALFP